MSRQLKFEEAYAESHGMPIETFSVYRMGNTYRLPSIAKCWRFLNMALDSEDEESDVLRKDANRYRFLRDGYRDGLEYWDGAPCVCTDEDSHFGDELDRVIDTAMGGGLDG